MIEFTHHWSSVIGIPRTFAFFPINFYTIVLYTRNKIKIHNFSLYKCVQSPRTMNNVDSVGPPDPVSNLRPIKYHIPKNESLVDRQLRLKRIEVAKWNHEFWTNHNLRFIKEREAYKKCLSDKGISAATADQMSEFYKDFLDKNWKSHMTYNFEWYKKNITIVRLMMNKNMFKAIQWIKIFKF